VLDFLGNLKRTHYCGALRASHADRDALVMGWVAKRRDLGNLLFLDVRDRTGIVQVVFNKETQPTAHAKAEQARGEFVVAVEGKVIKRQKANPDLPSGEVELVATKLHILNTAKTPPFAIEDETNAAEETRLRYRYLDLRRPRELRNLTLRRGTKVVLDSASVTLNPGEKIGFVEVFSEQEIRLAFMNVEPPPDGPVRQTSAIALSEGRTIELAVSFSDPWPTVHALYHDTGAVGSAVTEEEHAVVRTAAAPVPRTSFLYGLWRGFSAARVLFRPGSITAALAILLPPFMAGNMVIASCHVFARCL